MLLYYGRLHCTGSMCIVHVPTDPEWSKDVNNISQNFLLILNFCKTYNPTHSNICKMIYNNTAVHQNTVGKQENNNHTDDFSQLKHDNTSVQ